MRRGCERSAPPPSPLPSPSPDLTENACFSYLRTAVGTAKPSLSGFLTKVVSQATNIEPTVAVSNDTHTILVHKADNMTVAIFKDKDKAQ